MWQFNDENFLTRRVYCPPLLGPPQRRGCNPARGGVIAVSQSVARAPTLSTILPELQMGAGLRDNITSHRRTPQASAVSTQDPMLSAEHAPSHLFVADKLTAFLLFRRVVVGDHQ